MNTPLGLIFLLLFVSSFLRAQTPAGEITGRVFNAAGGVALESGYHLDYELLDLGLDSRAAAIVGGKQGAYEFGLSYDRIPHRISDSPHRRR